MFRSVSFLFWRFAFVFLGRKMTALDQRTGEAVAEAAALEETREKRLQEQKDWNATLAASQKARELLL